MKVRGLAVTEEGFPPLRAFETSCVTALGDGTVISGVPGVLRTPLGDCTPPSTRPGLLGIGVPCFPCVREFRTAARC